jgi:hypothetical protein
MGVPRPTLSRDLRAVCARYLVRPKTADISCISLVLLNTAGLPSLSRFRSIVAPSRRFHPSAFGYGLGMDRELRTPDGVIPMRSAIQVKAIADKCMPWTTPLRVLRELSPAFYPREHGLPDVFFAHFFFRSRPFSGFFFPMYESF